jgi:acyl-CoA thioester hydrolase
MSSIQKPQPLGREQFKVFLSITTRWMDNDCYGHVNNVVYYSWFDTAVNTYLIEQGVLDPFSQSSELNIIGLVVSSNCNYFDPISYPQKVEAGICVTKLGRSSVEYSVGIFRESLPLCSAQGSFVHVYVDKLSRSPVEKMPDQFKKMLEKIHV